jgi:hypothetical protein
MRQEAWKKAIVNDASSQLKNQLDEKNKMSKLNNELGKIENEMTSNRVCEITTFDQMLKDDKKKRQEMYRQMLTSQIQYNNGLKSFGNMTRVEKMMNRDDLKAYKKFDNNQYSMIPGFSNIKKYPKGYGEKHAKVTSYQEDQRRLEAYGYGRYLNKVPATVAPIENYNAAIPNSRQTNHGFNAMNRSFTGGNATRAEVVNSRDRSAAPISRRHQLSPRSPTVGALRNAGAISMSQEYAEQRPAGSPSGANPYRNL